VIDRAELIIRKGFRSEIDSYSAFFENDRRTPTGLAGYCATVVCGESSWRTRHDFCVHYSAVDARRSASTRACRGRMPAIDLAGSLDAAWAGMTAAGVQRVNDLWRGPSP